MVIRLTIREISRLTGCTPSHIATEAGLRGIDTLVELPDLTADALEALRSGQDCLARTVGSDTELNPEIVIGHLRFFCSDRFHQTRLANRSKHMRHQQEYEARMKAVVS